MNEFTLAFFTIALALAFDVMNGFHDAANSVATVVSTRVLRPLTAVAWAAFFNFIAMLLFGPKVAETISQVIYITPNEPTYLLVILAALIGALAWDILTWFYGLPTSSSHALIGGLAGAGIMYGGLAVLQFHTLLVIAIFIAVAPLIGLVLGSSCVCLLYWLNKKDRPGAVDKRFRKAQLLSAALYSIGHGANDAQKTMGIILAILIAAGRLSPSTTLSLYDNQTLWIILSCHLAMSLGTLLGGWRIVKTMGMKLTKIRPIGGFSAETAGALTLFGATIFGIPVSTTHTITGAIVGVGATVGPLSHVKWAIAARIVWAWVLTLPGAALMAAFVYWIFSFFL